MGSYLVTAGLLAAMAAVLNPERKELAHTVLSQPVVAAPIAGLLLGHPQVGLQAGAVFGLFWIGEQGCGTRRPANETLAALACVGASIASGSNPASIGAAMLLSAPLAVVGGMLDLARQERIAKLSYRMFQDTDVSPIQRNLARIQVRSLLSASIEGFFLVFTWILVASFGIHMLQGMIGNSLLQGLSALPAVLSAAAAGVALASLPGKEPAAVFALSASALVATGMLGG